MAPGRIAGHHRKSSIDSTNPVFSEPLRALEVAFREADARKSELYRRGFLPGGPTLIEHGPIRVLISPSPSTDTLSRYAAHLKSYNVKHIVRVCEPTYSAERLRGSGFEVHDWAFSDGDAPPTEVVEKWLVLLDQVFNLRQYTAHVGSDASSSDSDSPALLPKLSSGDTVLKETIAVHCMAGLGRAPVLVALALVELGMDPFEAVGWIRALRRGAINSRQMAFLENYRRRPPPSSTKPRKKRSSGIMGSLFSSGIKAAFRPKTPPGQRKSAGGLSGVQPLGTGSPYVAPMSSR